MNYSHCRATASIAIAALLYAALPSMAQSTWKPTRELEIVVAASPGGGTDQLARLIQSIIVKHRLIDVPSVVLNKGSNNGEESFVYLKHANGNPHKLVVGTNNAYLLPLLTGIGYGWTELTPLAAIAEDDFILWTSADAPYRTAKNYLDAVKAQPYSFMMGGSRLQDVDQALTFLLKKTEGAKFTYIALKSGSEAAERLADKRINSNVNNPSENISQWRAGRVKPLCVFSKARMVYTAKVTTTMAWSDIPTCREQGVGIDEYRFPRTVFMAGGTSPEQAAFYTDVLKKVVDTAEFKEYAQRNALAPAFIAGDAFKIYIMADEARARNIYRDAGWLAK